MCNDSLNRQFYWGRSLRVLACAAAAGEQIHGGIGEGFREAISRLHVRSLDWSETTKVLRYDANEACLVSEFLGIGSFVEP